MTGKGTIVSRGKSERKNDGGEGKIRILDYPSYWGRIK